MSLQLRQIAFTVAFLILTQLSLVAHADECGDGLKTQIAASDSATLLNELVKLAASGDKGPQFAQSFANYRQASGLSDQDIHEAIALQVTLQQAEANSKRPGEGLMIDIDEQEAQAAFAYAKEKALVM